MYVVRVGWVPDIRRRATESKEISSGLKAALALGYSRRSRTPYYFGNDPDTQFCMLVSVLINILHAAQFHGASSSVWEFYPLKARSEILLAVLVAVLASVHAEEVPAEDRIQAAVGMQLRCQQFRQDSGLVREASR